MCVNAKCKDKVTGRFKKAVPLCPACRYLAKRVFGATIAVCGVAWWIVTHLSLVTRHLSH